MSVPENANWKKKIHLQFMCHRNNYSSSFIIRKWERQINYTYIYIYSYTYIYIMYSTFLCIAMIFGHRLKQKVWLAYSSFYMVFQIMCISTIQNSLLICLIAADLRWIWTWVMVLPLTPVWLALHLSIIQSLYASISSTK